jgi:hypothetical protein
MGLNFKKIIQSNFKTKKSNYEKGFNSNSFNYYFHEFH